MSDDRRNDAAEDEFELDAEEPQDLEATVQEALEAVERAKGGGASDNGGSNDDEESLESPLAAELERLETENAALRERAVRALADFENYRKRMQRERAERARYASLDVIRDLLPVVDNLERALAAEGDIEDLKTGVSMISKQLHDLLRRHHVERIDSVGDAFDPALHEAVSKVEDDQVEEPTVVEQLQPGYQLRERLVRPAVVKVAMPASEAGVGAAGEGD